MKAGDPHGVIYWGAAPSVPVPDPVYLSNSTTTAPFVIPAFGASQVLSIAGGLYLIGQTLTVVSGLNFMTGIVTAIGTNSVTVSVTSIISGGTMPSGASVLGAQFSQDSTTSHQPYDFDGAAAGYLCICVPRQILPQINTLQFNASPLNLLPVVDVVVGSDLVTYNVYRSDAPLLGFTGITVLGR